MKDFLFWTVSAKSLKSKRNMKYKIAMLMIVILTVLNAMIDTFYLRMYVSQWICFVDNMMIQTVIVSHVFLFSI
jgi:hypothetical protein